MDGAAAGAPRRTLVVFHGEGCGFWPWLCGRAGFRHCFVAIDDGRVWIEIDPRGDGLHVQAEVPADCDLASHYRALGYVVTETVVRSDRRRYRAPWVFTCVETVTGTDYVALDVMRDATTKNIYVCTVAHTSSTFAADLAAGKWAEAIDVADVEAAKAAAEAAQAAAEGAQAAAETAEANAETAQAAAAASASAAATSATNAGNSASASAANADAAENSALAAQTAETNAETAGANAEAAAVAAEMAATNAASSASAAATSEANAGSSALEATASAAAAEALYEDLEAVEAAKTAAETAETNAETAATNAASSASAAATSDSNAGNSAAAATSAASSASLSATIASNAATAAQTAETNAETAEVAAEVAQAAAEAAETNAEIARAAAETAATNAASSASAAETSAINTGNSATAAATSAIAAQSAEANAATAQAAAEAAQAAAEAAAANGIAIVPRGTWQAGTTYSEDDGVTHAGSFWRSLQASNQGNSPDSSPSQWELSVSKGDQGDQGAPGNDGLFAQIASQADAEAGTDNSKGMTPLRTAQAIAASGGGGSGGGMEFLMSVDCAGQSTVNFLEIDELGDVGEFARFLFVIDNPILPSISATTFYAEIGEFGGANWETGSYVAFGHAVHSSPAEQEVWRETNRILLCPTAGMGSEMTGAFWYSTGGRGLVGHPFPGRPRWTWQTASSTYFATGGGGWNFGDWLKNDVRFRVSMGSMAKGRIALFGIHGA